MKTIITFYIEVYPNQTEKAAQTGFFMHQELPTCNNYNEKSKFYKVSIPVETIEVQAESVNPVVKPVTL